MRALVLTAVLPAAAAAADLQLPSRIEEVTVYQSSARVVRAVAVDLPAGESRLLLRGLPEGLADDSVRVSGKGSARARVQGVSVEPVTAEAAASPEVRAAEGRLEALRQEDRELEDRLRGAAARRAFVESLRSTYSEERAKNLALRPVSAREWAEVVAFAAREWEATGVEIRRAEARRRELAHALDAAAAELDKLRAKRSTATRTVAVELRAERAGHADLQVSYLVPLAGWRPVWDARLSPEAGAVELSLHGSVEQRSGEDWSQVALALSTARPGRTLRVPELQPRWLERPRPAPAAAPARPSAGVLRAPGVAARAEEASGAAEVVEAEPARISEGLLSTVFAAPGRHSVDGAGRARKVFLAAFTLPAEPSRVTAPRADPSVFLAAKAANRSGATLLPGPADVFLGDEFVGRARLPAVPPGDEVDLAFGVDDRVKAQRRVVERRHETAGLLTKEDVVRYHVRTTVKNLWPRPVTVRLLDLVPVSREEDIRVELLDGTTPATEPDDPQKPGVKTWLLTLDPKQEKAVELRYQVRFPRGLAVSGLE